MFVLVVPITYIEGFIQLFIYLILVIIPLIIYGMGIPIIERIYTFVGNFIKFAFIRIFIVFLYRKIFRMYITMVW